MRTQGRSRMPRNKARCRTVGGHVVSAPRRHPPPDREPAHENGFTGTAGRHRRTPMGSGSQSDEDRGRGDRRYRDAGGQRGHLRREVGGRESRAAGRRREGPGDRARRDPGRLGVAIRFGHRALRRAGAATGDLRAQGFDQGDGGEGMDHALRCRRMGLSAPDGDRRGALPHGRPGHHRQHHDQADRRLAGSRRRLAGCEPALQGPCDDAADDQRGQEHPGFGIRCRQLCGRRARESNAGAVALNSRS